MQEPLVAAPRTPDKPVVRYDAECAFCRHEVERLVRFSGGRVRTEPLQSAVHGGPAIDEIKLITPEGRTFGGAEAVFRTLALRPVWRPLFWLYQIPGLRQVANAAYRQVAKNRYRYSAVACAQGVCAQHFREGVAAPVLEAPMLGDGQPTYRRSAKVFLVLLGLMHLAAFAGLYPQVLTLMGRDGLMPVEAILAAVRASGTENPHLDFPTLFWLNSSDGALRAGCLVGAGLSICVVLGLLRRTCLFLLGVLYISYAVAGTTFFYYQWDNLLIETTLHALLLPSYSRALVFRRGATASRLRMPHPSVIFLVHWLLFRVMFESGLAKIQVPAGGWRDLSAMKHYYNTAPLPTWLGWYAHNLPVWWHQWEGILTLVVELLLPVFIFASRRWRRKLFVVCSVFQLGILLTANYGLFNFIALALGLFLLEDRDYEFLFRVGRWLRGARGQVLEASASGTVYAPGILVSLGRSALVFVATAAIVAASLLEFVNLVSDPKADQLLGENLSKRVAPWHQAYNHVRLVNSYHLFASMTRERLVPEIQGLNERGEWVPYRYRFAPGDPASAPRFAAPYHPRFDFQVWWVTLSGPVERRHPFFMRLIKILREHPERASEFFAADPFAGSAPRQIRVMVYRYNMSDPETRKREGTWWRREEVGPLSIDSSR